MLIISGDQESVSAIRTPSDRVNIGDPLPRVDYLMIFPGGGENEFLRGIQHIGLKFPCASKRKSPGADVGFI